VGSGTTISHLKQFIVKVCQCTIVDVRQTLTLFEYLLIQNRMVHSPTHSRTIDPSSPMAQSMCVCVCVCVYFCVCVIANLLLNPSVKNLENWSAFEKNVGEGMVAPF